jgi:hypothetical protein
MTFQPEQTTFIKTALNDCQEQWSVLPVSVTDAER